MRLAYKLTFLLGIISAGPLALTTAVTLPRSASDLRHQLDELYQANAQAMAEEFDGALQQRASAIQLYAGAMDLHELESDELMELALGLIYRQTRNASAVALVDASGAPVTDPVRMATPRARGFPNQEATDEALAAFGENLPFREALELGTVVIGPHYSVPDEDGRPLPRVAVATPARSQDKARWVLAAELSLRPIVERLDGFKLGRTGTAKLVDEGGKVIWGRSGVSDPDREVFGATAKLRNVPWAVVVEQERTEALAPIQRQYRYAVVWAVGILILALLLGFTTVRTVTRPLATLETAVARVESGDLDMDVPVTGRDEIARLSSAFNTMTARLRERERLRTSLSRYLSQPVADRIMNATSDFDVRAEQVEATVVFIDIRDFTPISERLPPGDVVSLLNVYFDLIVHEVLRNEGVVLKFTGDGVMVMFTRLEGRLPAADRAVAAAMEILRAVSEMNQVRAAEGREVAEFGVGINSGQVIAGNVGSTQRLEYTIIGDTVNVAARLQALASRGEVVISAAVRDEMTRPLRVEALGEIQVKGRHHPVVVFRVVGQLQRSRQLS